MSEASGVRYSRIEDTTWPVDVGNLEWQLRYAPQAVAHFVAASVVAAYGYLIDPSLPEKEALAAFIRARKAAAPASRSGEAQDA